MIKLLLLIILFIIFFPIVKVWLLMRRSRKNFQEMYEQAQRAQARPSPSGRSAGEYDGMGEYADFEDVGGAERLEPEESEPTYSEQQVVDAEFEDLDK